MLLFKENLFILKKEGYLHIFHSCVCIQFTFKDIIHIYVYLKEEKKEDFACKANKIQLYIYVSYSNNNSLENN